ncbi:MAG: hypothetical protein ACLVJH_05285 [Faecalibacterium prausnitzii]
MLIFGFWFVTEVSCQIVYGDIDRVFHIEENIRKMKDAELEAALARGLRRRRHPGGISDKDCGKERCPMEQRNNLVLQGTETFSRGQLDNLALENGALVLDSVAGRSLLYGSYTTPEFAMPAFCNLNVSWNAHAPRDTMVEVRCRVYAAGAWTAWMSFGKWAPDYPRCSVSSQSEDGMIFLMGDTVTVARPGRRHRRTIAGRTFPPTTIKSPRRCVCWRRRCVPLRGKSSNGHALNRRLYLPEYCLSAHDPSFGREMDLPLVMAALMNRWGEDILPEEVAYAMEDRQHRHLPATPPLRRPPQAAAATPAGRRGWTLPTCGNRSTTAAR